MPTGDYCCCNTGMRSQGQVHDNDCSHKHQYVPIKGRDNLARDIHSKAILNADSDEYERRKAARQVALNRNKEIAQLKKDVSRLEKKTDKILELLENFQLILKQNGR